MDDFTRKKIQEVMSFLSHEKGLWDGFREALRSKGVLAGVLGEAIRPNSLDYSLALIKQTNLEMSKLGRHSTILELSERIGGLTPEWKEQLAHTSVRDLQAHVERMLEISMLGEKSIAGLSMYELRRRFSSEVREILQLNVTSLTQSYFELFKSLEPSRTNFLTLHPVISSLPPIEFYNEATVTEALTTDPLELTDDRIAIGQDIARENTDALDLLLRAVDSEFVNLLNGAREALSSDNPDRVRHFTASLRELHAHVIHRLAPDKDLLSWTRDPHHYDKNGKPTRTARLLYINRHINHPPFSAFVEDDIRSILSLLELLNKGIHKVKGDFTTEQLHAILVRAECSLRFILEIGLKSTGPSNEGSDGP